ncbi:10781_t:CDS:2, partial [Racocetra persica]
VRVIKPYRLVKVRARIDFIILLVTGANIIKEANRIIPVATFITRCISEEDEVASLQILFRLNFLGVNRNSKFWSNLAVFDPDRPTTLYWKKAGMLILMVLIYKNYNIELTDTDEPFKPFKYVAGIVANCKELKVRISPRI